MGLIFFSGGWGGYFWEVVVGVHHPPHLIFTLFQSNIYKVNARESSSPGTEGTKECPGERARICRSPCQKKYYIYSLGQLERLYNTISDKNKT